MIKNPYSVPFILFVFAGLLCPFSAVCADDPLDQANTLYYKGNYEEAKEAFAKVDGENAAGAALGIARCHRSVGQLDESVAVLQKAAKQFDKDARFPGLLAQIAFDRGDHKSADHWVARAFLIDDQQVAARWVEAEMHRLAGRMEEAAAAYEWFIDYYNDTNEFDSPEQLHYVGLAAAQYARWNRVHDQFSFLVQTLYPEILELEKNYWPARLESGMLFLEKFSEPEAETDFQAAVALNANAAEAYAAVARLALLSYQLDKARKAVERALEINPNLLVAHQLKADIEMANFEPQKAEDILNEALKLCPTSESTLGRIAAAQGCLDGLTVPAAADSRMAVLIKKVTDKNSHAGEFFEALADSLDTMRRYPQAAYYYQRAITVMPQLIGAHGKLGMVHMRLGEERKAEKLLKTAWEIDFENVRIDNSRKVLELLDNYETLETEHFIVKYDVASDRILARYVAEYLEKIYPDLCRQLGYHPKEKSLFEIFNKSGNTGGHGWFSARMVGLPHIHTIAACAGKMVGMVSPAAMDEQFNWARVVKHEFVHVINLQQTNFNIPHWFTEALAVYNEGYPRSPEWNAMLVRRAENKQVYDLKTINLGFIRPSSSDDWQMAYCQAELYAEYMLARFGDDALAKMLDGYADNLNTKSTIQRAFKVTQADFEKGYQEYVAKIVGQLPAARNIEKANSFAVMEKNLQEDPDNPDLLGDVAIGYLNRKAYPKARKLAQKALKREKDHQGATYVMVRLQLVTGDSIGALEKLDAALQPDDPHRELLSLLAALKFNAKKYDEAAQLYELGRRFFPTDKNWLNKLVLVHHKAGNNDKTIPLLVERAELNADDLSARKVLATSALAEQDYEQAVRWSREGIYIDVLDSDLHRILAVASVEQEDYTTGIREYETAIEIEPAELHLRFALANACAQAGQKDKAKQVLDKLLELDTDFPGADTLRDSLDTGEPR